MSVLLFVSALEGACLEGIRFVSHFIQRHMGVSVLNFVLRVHKASVLVDVMLLGGWRVKIYSRCCFIVEI
jgi:hypothetical protein